MYPVPVEEVERAMRRLDRAELLAFVAAAWAARGRETAVDGGTVLAREPSTGVERRVAVAATRRGVVGARLGLVDDVDARADVVVTPAPGRVRERVDGDVRVLGPAAVRDLLRYGLDGRAGERLARRHLDVSLLVPEPSTTGASGPGRPAWLVPAVVAALAVVGLAVAAAGLGTPPGLGSAPGPGGDDGRSGVVADGSTAVASTTSTSASGSASDTESGSGSGSAALARETPIPTVLYVESLPPGLEREGVGDVTRLAAGHREAVAGAPYALVATVERRNARGTAVLTSRTSVRVWNRSVYRFNRSATRRVDGTTIDLDREGYADGEALYVRDGDSYRRTPLSASVGGEEPYTEAVVGLLVDALGTDETSLRAYLYFGQARYRVVASGASSTRIAEDAGGSAGANASAAAAAPGLRLPLSADVANRTTFATIRPTGLVRQLRVVAERPDGTEVTVEVRYVTVGYLPGERATVEPPPWYAAARTATTDRPDHERHSSVRRGVRAPTGTRGTDAAVRRVAD